VAVLKGPCSSRAGYRRAFHVVERSAAKFLGGFFERPGWALCVCLGVLSERYFFKQLFNLYRALFLGMVQLQFSRHMLMSDD
jgi:hypothetical protein